MQRFANIESISIVVPVKDEEECLVALYGQLLCVLSGLCVGRWEVIFVDDGSNDRSWDVMCELVSSHPDYIKAIRLRRNFGKSVALAAGFREATGSIVFTIDADLQDDPSEIPIFLSKICEGYDLVSGWKYKRLDPLSKTLPSKIFNKVTAILTGIPLHDFNCGFKAYRKEVLNSVKLYGEMHRYIPVLAYDSGYRIGEVAVNHRPRKSGVSKYGWERYARGFLDLLTVLATTRYSQKPGHLFGGVGICVGALGTIILSYLTLCWFLGAGPIGTRPLFFLGILLEILSFQLISLGIIAEIVVRGTDIKPLNAIITEIQTTDINKQK